MAAITGVVLIAVGGVFVDYDAAWALVWGDQIVHGQAPSYGVPLAPTPHPLSTGFGAVASLFGDGFAATEALAVVALFMLTLGVYQLATVAFRPAVGIVATALVLTSYVLLSAATAALLDIPFAALVVWAAVLETREPKRGLPVLALLCFAGLLRPEAWLLAGAYWLYLRRYREGPLLLLTAAAPVIWTLADLRRPGTRSTR